MSIAPPTKKKSESESKSASTATIIAAAIGAIATIVAAVIGVYLVKDSQGSAPEPGPSSTAPASSSSSPPPPTTTAPPPPDPTAPTVRHSTGGRPLTLSGDYSADLDSMDSAWDVQWETSGDDIDVVFYHLDLYAENGDLAIVSGPAKYETCQDATGYEPEIHRGDLDPGLKICFRTSDKRRALVTVKKYSEERNQIQLDVTVWDPPFEE